MASVSISALLGGGSAEFGPGGLNEAGRICLEARLGGPENEMNFPTAPGVDGSGSKNYGFRRQRLVLKLLYVAASEADARADWLDDAKIMADGCNVTVDGATFYACFLDAAGALQEQPRPAGSLYRAEATVVLEARRNSA